MNECELDKIKAKSVRFHVVITITKLVRIQYV